MKRICRKICDPYNDVMDGGVVVVVVYDGEAIGGYSLTLSFLLNDIRKKERKKRTKKKRK